LLNSPLAVALVTGASGALVMLALQDFRAKRIAARKAVRWLDRRIGSWWTRNWGYIPHGSRAPDFRHVEWWRTGPYWLNSRPQGYSAERGPRDWLGRPVPPEQVGIEPYGESVVKPWYNA
jgi:hypothetical protein